MNPFPAGRATRPGSTGVGRVVERTPADTMSAQSSVQSASVQSASVQSVSADSGTTRGTIVWRAVLGVALVVETATFVATVDGTFAYRPFWAYAVGFPVFAVALVALSRARLDLRAALVTVLAVGAVFQIVALSRAPISSDDAYRYGWDAKVQLAGIDPYRYAPSDPALDRLRSTTLFAMKTGHCTWPLPGNICSAINRPTVHTVYPPVAEAAFTLTRLAGLARTDGTVPVQVFAALGAMALSMLLAVRAMRRRRPMWTVAVWSWCPLTVIELGNNAHIDWLAVLLSVGALMVGRELVPTRGTSGVAAEAERPGEHGARRATIAGALVGAAVATKIYPALIGASLLRRHPARVIGAAAAVFLLSYVPHVLAVGSAVVGFLPDYVKQENYLSGGRFLVLSLLVPKRISLDVAVFIIVATLIWAVRRSDPRAPEMTAVATFGVVLMVTTPVYSWYSLMLLALIAMTGWVAWLPMVVGAAISMVAVNLVSDAVTLHLICYTCATVLTLIALRFFPAPVFAPHDSTNNASAPS